MNENVSNKIYDVLKVISLLIAPIGVFVVTMLHIWTNVDTAGITATIAAIETLLGALLTISSNKYWRNKGENDEAR